MKLLLVLAVCIYTVAGEDVRVRGVDFHTLHYDQHRKTLEEAKRKMFDDFNGQHAQFEEVGSYGGVGEVGVGTVGFSSTNLGGGEYSSGSNVGLSSSAGSKFGASHSANFASSSSFGSDSKFDSGSYGSAGYNPGSSGGSSLLVPIIGESTSTSFSESSATKNLHQMTPEVIVSGGSGDQKGFLHHHTNNGYKLGPCTDGSHLSNSVLSKSFGGQEEHIAETIVPSIQFSPSSAFGQHFHYEGSHIRNQDRPLLHYTAPIVRSEKYQGTPQIQFPTSIGDQESYLKLNKKIATATHPQILLKGIPASSSNYHHQGTVGAITETQLTPMVTAGFSDSATNYNGDYYGHTAFPTHESNILPTGNSKSIFKSNFDSSLQAASKYNMNSAFSAGHQSGFGFNSAQTDAASFGSKLATGTAFGASTSGLTSYMQESERLAKQQAHGMSVGGAHVSGSQYGSNYENSNIASYSGVGGGSASKYDTAYENTAGSSGFNGLTAVGAGNSGYKKTSWEKASKWSSQTELGPGGAVNSFNKLSTGESEDVDINGHRAGYKAATTTLDDNGTVSTYSHHT